MLLYDFCPVGLFYFHLSWRNRIIVRSLDPSEHYTTLISTYLFRNELKVRVKWLYFGKEIGFCQRFVYVHARSLLLDVNQCFPTWRGGRPLMVTYRLLRGEGAYKKHKKQLLMQKINNCNKLYVLTFLHIAYYFIGINIYNNCIQFYCIINIFID